MRLLLVWFSRRTAWHSGSRTTVTTSDPRFGHVMVMWGPLDGDYEYAVVRLSSNTIQDVIADYRIAIMPNLLPLVTPCFSENHSLDTIDSAKVAELKVIWTAKAEQCYYRAQFMRNFAMPIAETPSHEFIYIKDAIMYAIKPYTNIRALGIQDMGIAIAYNRVSYKRTYFQIFPYPGLRQY